MYKAFAVGITVVLIAVIIAYALFIQTTGNDAPNRDLYSPNTLKVLHKTTASAPLDEDGLVTPVKPLVPAPNLPAPLPKPDIVGKSPFDQLPEELRNQLRNVYTEMGYGNFDQAAHIARDALELTHEYPVWRVELHFYQGLCYQRLGYTYMAMEQYSRALALQPMHRGSYAAMRRISPEFASANEELPPIKVALPMTTPSER